jgi:hypothetical protein
MSRSAYSLVFILPTLIVPSKSFEYLAFTPTRNLKGARSGTQSEFSRPGKEESIGEGDRASLARYLAWNLILICRCNFCKKPHHAGDDVIMPESFPAQLQATAEPESSVLDLPQEHLDEVRRFGLYGYERSYACMYFIATFPSSVRSAVTLT